MPKYKGNRIRVVGNLICIHLATHESKHLVFRRGGALEYKYLNDFDKEDPFIRFRNLFREPGEPPSDILTHSDIIHYNVINKYDDESWTQIEITLYGGDKVKVNRIGEIYRKSKRLFNIDGWIRVSHTNPNEPYVEPADNKEIDSINLYRRSDINNIIRMSNIVESGRIYNELKKEANKIESENDKAIVLKFLEDCRSKLNIKENNKND